MIWKSGRSTSQLQGRQERDVVRWKRVHILAVHQRQRRAAVCDLPLCGVGRACGACVGNDTERNEWVAIGGPTDAGKDYKAVFFGGGHLNGYAYIMGEAAFGENNRLHASACILTKHLDGEEEAKYSHDANATAYVSSADVGQTLERSDRSVCFPALLFNRPCDDRKARPQRGSMIRVALASADFVAVAVGTVEVGASFSVLLPQS